MIAPRKKRILIGMLCLLFSQIFGATTLNGESKKSIKLLWMGTSSTNPYIVNYVDEMLNSHPNLEVSSERVRKRMNIPAMVAREREKGTVVYDKSAMTEAQFKEKLKGKDVDYVILQVSYYAFKYDVMDGMSAKIQELCRYVQEAGATPVLFEAPVISRYYKKKYGANQKEMTELCLAVARENKVPVAFSGAAWDAIEKEKGNDYLVNAKGKDKGHAGPYGNFVIACSFYATLTGESPVGASVPKLSATLTKVKDGKSFKEENLKEQYEASLSEEDALHIQKTVWEVHQQKMNLLLN